MNCGWGLVGLNPDLLLILIFLNVGSFNEKLVGLNPDLLSILIF
jgi:hypothetical protein